MAATSTGSSDADGEWKIAHRVVVHEWDQLEHVEPAFPPGRFTEGRRDRDDVSYGHRLAGLMRYAFTAAQSNCTWAELADAVGRRRRARRLHHGWVYDHFYPLRTGPEEPTLEGWTCLAMLLARTQRLRGGVMVTGIPYRHPAVLANMAVTVDIASGGRLELGLGAGWFEPECEAYGIELGSIAERFERFEEALTVIRSLLTEETTTFDGQHYRLRDARCEPKAVQSPHPPIVLGGKGERRLLPLVARFADHWNYSGDDVDEYRRLRARLGELCEAEERRVDDLTLSVNVRPAADGAGAVAEQAAAYGEAGATMACVVLSRPYDPRVLEKSAQALAGTTESAGRVRRPTDEIRQLAHEGLLEDGPDEHHVGGGVDPGEGLEAGAVGAGALEEVERPPVAQLVVVDLDADLVAHQGQPLVAGHRASAPHRQQERPVLLRVAEVRELPVGERQHLPAVVDEVARARVAVDERRPGQLGCVGVQPRRALLEQGYRQLGRGPVHVGPALDLDVRRLGRGRTVQDALPVELVQLVEAGGRSRRPARAPACGPRARRPRRPPRSP